MPGKPEDATEDTESTAVETGNKEEERKIETENDGDKVEEIDIDVEGDDGKDQQSEKGWKVRLY